MDEISDDSVDDVESSIQRELETLGNKGGKPHTFRAVRLDIPCLLFFKTKLPVDPAEFVHSICQEIVTKPEIRKMRYINRLTPMSCIGKATEKGLEDVGKTVLRKHFQLSGEESRGEEKQSSCSVSARIFTQLPRISLCS
jgi:tRNA acetyltransferase TAN1